MRTRIVCGVLGAGACLLAALFLETVFHFTHASQRLDEAGTRTLIFQSDLARRLELAGAHGGDVEISLSWNDTNDLDLSCVEPSGERIFYGTGHPTRTGGQLDVDRNSQQPYTNTPVEHIFWPRGRAPAGSYHVFVSYYAPHGGPERSPYHVHIVNRGRVRDFSGAAVYERTPPPLVEVAQFNVGEPGLFERWIDPNLLISMVVVGLWGAALGGLLSVALWEGQRRCLIYLHRRQRRQDSSKALTTLSTAAFDSAPSAAGNGLIAGAVAGLIAQLAFRIYPSGLSSEAQHLFRLVGLAIFGGILGFGLSLTVPNLPRIGAIVGGAVGGWVGGVLLLLSFDQGADAAARLWVAVLLGFAIGFMISFVFETVHIAESEEAPGLRMSLKPMRRGAYRTNK